MDTNASLNFVKLAIGSKV